MQIKEPSLNEFREGSLFIVISIQVLVVCTNPQDNYIVLYQDIIIFAPLKS